MPIKPKLEFLKRLEAEATDEDRQANAEAGWSEDPTAEHFRKARKGDALLGVCTPDEVSAIEKSQDYLKPLEVGRIKNEEVDK